MSLRRLFMRCRSKALASLRARETSLRHFSSFSNTVSETERFRFGIVAAVVCWRYEDDLVDAGAASSNLRRRSGWCVDWVQHTVLIGLIGS